MGKNGMELVRRNEPLLETVHNAINPFLSGAMRKQGNDATMFLRCAAQQLEGVDFDIRSLGPALVTFAMAGLLPNKALGHGFLIPFKKKGIAQIVPVIGYKGLVELGMRARPTNGAILTSKRFDVVLDYERFEVGKLGIDEACARHHPAGDRDPTNEKCYEAITYAYAQFNYAVNVGGLVHTYHETELMGRGDIDAARRMSKAQSGPQFDWPIRMAQKVPVRRICASGRIPLGMYPGAALAAEGAADVGEFSDYLDYLRGAAQTDRQQDALGPVLELGAKGFEQNGESDDTHASLLDQYERDAKTIRKRLAKAETDDAANVCVRQLKQLWGDIMGDLQWHDEQAQNILDERENRK